MAWMDLCICAGCRRRRRLHYEMAALAAGNGTITHEPIQCESARRDHRPPEGAGPGRDDAPRGGDVAPARLYELVGTADGVAGAPRKLVVREIPLWPGDPAAAKLKDWDEVLGALFPVNDGDGTAERPTVLSGSIRIGTIATSWNEGGYEITANTTASSFPRQLSLRAVRDNEDYHYVQVLRPANPDGGLGE